MSVRWLLSLPASLPDSKVAQARAGALLRRRTISPPPSGLPRADTLALAVYGGVMARHFQSGPGKLKRRRRSHRWKANDQIFDLAVTFTIDEEIRKAQLQLRWQLTDAILFGRRTLAVAVEDANAYANYRPGEALAYWSRTEKLAIRAHRTLDDLVKHIGPAGVPSADILVPIQRVPSSMLKSRKIVIKLLPRGQPPDQAKKDFSALLAARDACAGFMNRTQQRRKSLANRRKNEGGQARFRVSVGRGLDFSDG